MGEVIEFSRKRADREAMRRKLREMTLSEVIMLWEISDDQPDGYWIEDIYAELNSRGYGRPCSV